MTRDLALIALLCSLPVGASAHSFYDPACCSGTDCKPATAGDVTWTPTGWNVQSMKETVPFNSSKLRTTPIGEPPFHECIWHTTLTCLYVPEPQS